MASHSKRGGSSTNRPSPHARGTRAPLLPLLLPLALSLLLALSLVSPAAAKRAHPLRRGKAADPKRESVVTYHGGPVLGRTGPVTVYLVYYGNWGTQSGRTQQRLISTFVHSMSADAGREGRGRVPSVKDWWASVTQYYALDANGRKYQVNPNVRLGQVVFDNYSLGNKWTTKSSIWNAISNHLDAGDLPVDPNGVYVLLASQDMYIVEDCPADCGWHGMHSYKGTPLAYALVVDSTMPCLAGCGYTFPAGPRRTGAMEGTLDTLGHELMEAVSNPSSAWPGWYSDADGDEIGDLCQGNGTVPFGGRRKGQYVYNMVGLNGTPFAVQPVYSLATGQCELRAQVNGTKDTTHRPDRAVAPLSSPGPASPALNNSAAATVPNATTSGAAPPHQPPKGGVSPPKGGVSPPKGGVSPPVPRSNGVNTSGTALGGAAPGPQSSSASTRAASASLFLSLSAALGVMLVGLA